MSKETDMIKRLPIERETRDEKMRQAFKKMRKAFQMEKQNMLNGMEAFQRALAKMEPIRKAFQMERDWILKERAAFQKKKEHFMKEKGVTQKELADMGVIMKPFQMVKASLGRRRASREVAEMGLTKTASIKEAGDGEDESFNKEVEMMKGEKEKNDLSMCKERKKQAHGCKGPNNPKHDRQGCEAISQINS